MYHSKSILDRNSLRPIYLSYIRRFVEYADVLDNYSQHETNELEKIIGSLSYCDRCYLHVSCVHKFSFYGTLDGELSQCLIKITR